MVERKVSILKFTLGPKSPLGCYHARNEAGENFIISGDVDELKFEEGKEVLVKQKPNPCATFYEHFVETPNRKVQVYITRIQKKKSD